MNPKAHPSRPLVALTMGDVAGVGPEIIARAWADPLLHALARPVLIGAPAVLARALATVGGQCRIVMIEDPREAHPDLETIPCVALESGTCDLDSIAPGRVDVRAGRAAYQFLIAATDLALQGRIDAIVTLPLNKKALALAGVPHPGHTEILAERCGVREHAMMLYLETAGETGRDARKRGVGLGVVHATLHVALKRVFELLTVEMVEAKIRLADAAMRPLTGQAPPLIAAAALNPHAGEDGLFGDEETRIIQPAVARARASGIDVDGPHPNDTLFGRALAGEYDAVVAMYHDQGHIALKTAGFHRAVNVTLGLPIVRVSVAHGTAFDIAWRGVADPSSLIAAVRTAGRIVAGKASVVA